MSERDEIAKMLTPYERLPQSENVEDRRHSFGWITGPWAQMFGEGPRNPPKPPVAPGPLSRELGYYDIDRHPFAAILPNTSDATRRAWVQGLVMPEDPRIKGWRR